MASMPSCSSDLQEIDGREANHSFTRKQKIVLVACLISQFLSSVCSSQPAPFLPSQDETHNIQSDITGCVIGLLPLTQLFVCPFFGKLVTYVPVKTMLVGGLAVCGVFTMLFGILDYLPLPDEGDDTVDILYLVLEIFLRIAQSLGAGSIFVAAMTLLTMTFTENTTSILSYAQTAIGLGYMVGPALGSGLFKIGGCFAIFVCVGAIMVTVAIITWFALPMDDEVSAESSGNSSVYNILFNKKIMAALALTAFVGTLWSSIQPILEPELREKYGLKQGISALAFLLLPIPFTVASPVLGIVLDKVRCLTALDIMMAGFLINAINFLFMGPCPLFIGFNRPLWLLLLTLCIMGLGIAFCLVPSLVLLEFNDHDIHDKAYKAILSGLWTSAYALGDFIGPTYSGIMTEYTNFGWTMTTYGFSCMFTTFIIITIKLYYPLKKYCDCRKRSASIDESLPLLA